MPPGIALVVFWLLVVTLGIAAVLVVGYRSLVWWLNAPDEPVVPLPNQSGAECVVLHFAEQFLDTVPKSEIPEWRRYRYTEVAEGKLVLTDELAEMMLLASLAELWQQGLLSFRVVAKDPDPFDPHSLDKEVLVSMGQMLPLTPLGRCFTVGYRIATRPVWLLREKRNEAVLEDLVEFALREVRRSLGWRKAKRNSAENLVRYVKEFLATTQPPSGAVANVKGALEALRAHDEALAEALQATIRYTLLALRRLEPDRDELGL